MLTDVRPIQLDTTERVTLLVGDQLIQKIDAIGLESSITTIQLQEKNCTPSSFVGGVAW
jgi:hypothetical protein